MLLPKEKESKQNEHSKLTTAISQLDSRNNEQKEKQKIPQGTKLEPKGCNLISRQLFACTIFMSVQEFWYSMCMKSESSDRTISTYRVKKQIGTSMLLKGSVPLELC